MITTKRPHQRAIEAEEDRIKRIRRYLSIRHHRDVAELKAAHHQHLKDQNEEQLEMDAVQVKRCIGPCDRMRPITDYYLNPGASSGRGGVCKHCIADRNRKRNAQNTGHRAKIARKARDEVLRINKEHIDNKLRGVLRREKETNEAFTPEQSTD